MLSQQSDEEGTMMDTRELILEVAEKLCMEHGYAAVSMSQILEAINLVRPLSMPAIYYHFTTKEDLYAEVLISMGERVGRTLYRRMTGSSQTYGNTEMPLALGMMLAELNTGDHTYTEVA